MKVQSEQHGYKFSPSSRSNESHPQSEILTSTQRPRIGFVTTPHFVSKSPSFVGLAKTTPQTGARHLRREREKQHQQQLLGEVIVAAARTWNGEAFNNLYPLFDRIQIGWEAVLFNLPRILGARNENAMAFAIVRNTLRKIYREEFSNGVPRYEQLDNEVSVADHLELQVQLQEARLKLLGVLKQLEPIQQRVLDLYYGLYDGRSLSVRAIADMIHKPTSTTHWIYQQGIRRLRELLGVALSS